MNPRSLPTWAVTIIAVMREALDVPEYITDLMLYERLAQKPGHHYTLPELRIIIEQLRKEVLQ